MDPEVLRRIAAIKQAQAMSGGAPISERDLQLAQPVPYYMPGPKEMPLPDMPPEHIIGRPRDDYTEQQEMAAMQQMQALEAAREANAGGPITDRDAELYKDSYRRLLDKAPRQEQQMSKKTSSKILQALLDDRMQKMKRIKQAAKRGDIRVAAVEGM